MLIHNSDRGPQGLGYLLLDNRNAPMPGVPLPHFEADTYTCSHCQTVVVMNPLRTRERYKCRGCSHHICDPCAAKRAEGAACKTWAQHVDQVLAQAERQAEATSPLILP